MYNIGSNNGIYHGVSLLGHWGGKQMCNNIIKLLNKRDLRKVYKSMVVYLDSKLQADKFFKKRLFKIEKENAYTNI